MNGSSHKSETSFETDGYLSDEVSSVIRDFQVEDAELHSDFCSLARLAHARMNSCPISNRDLQALMITLIIGRLLSLYEAIYILSCRGMKAESQTLLRSMLETHLKLHFCVMSPQNADELVKSAELDRLRSLEAAIRHGKHSPEQQIELAKITAQIRADNQALEAKKLSIKEIARRTNRMWEYELTYAHLCRSAHSDSRELQSDFELDSHGNIKAIQWGPDHTAAGLILSTAMDYMFQALINPVVPMVPANSQEAILMHETVTRHINTYYRITDTGPELG